MRLEDWSVSVVLHGPYDAPETFLHNLNGEVYGHPRFEDGTRVSTSAIVRVSTHSVRGTEIQTEIQTESGSLYILGQPSDDYVKWCRDRARVPRAHPEKPIKLVGDE